jgi:hypothetical protein
MFARCAVCLAVVATAAATSARAGAEPRLLPFTYTADPPEKGEVEVEQYVDLTPVKAVDPTGNHAWIVLPEFQTEFEYGITDRLELGLYVTYAPTPGEYTFVPDMPEGTGAKQRLKYVFAPSGEWPIDVGVYGEIAENDHEVELEGKILLQRRLGNLLIASNLWAEYELYYPVYTRDAATGTSRTVNQRDVVLNPTLGASYEFSSLFHLGLEGWMRVELPSPAPATRDRLALGPAAYAGPAFVFNFGALWWSTGVYARVTDTSQNLVAGSGEPYGPFWVRTVLGFEL